MSDTMNVRRVAELARLYVSPDEEARLSAEMEGILALARQLQQLEVSDVPEMQHMMSLNNVFRKDVPQPCLTKEVILNAAPARVDDLIAVPRAVE